MPGKASRRPSGSINQWILVIAAALLSAVAMFAIFASVFPLDSCSDPLDPDVRNRIRKEWDDERRRHDEELKQRAEDEKFERLRLNLFWGDLKAHTCSSYGTRTHTARLLNLPANYDHRIEACMATPIQIRGAKHNATLCEDHVGALYCFRISS